MENLERVSRESHYFFLPFSIFSHSPFLQFSQTTKLLLSFRVIGIMHTFLATAYLIGESSILHFMLIRLLPKRESAIISPLCSAIFRSRRRSRTSCGFSRMTQRVRRTWRRSDGQKASPASTVVGMASRAASRTDPPSCFDVATVSVTRRSQPTRSCSAHIRRSRSGFGPHTSCRAKPPA